MLCLFEGIVNLITFSVFWIPSPAKFRQDLIFLFNFQSVYSVMWYTDPVKLLYHQIHVNNVNVNHLVLNAIQLNVHLQVLGAKPCIDLINVVQAINAVIKITIITIYSN